jgi:SAM-dependent methyltransferase
MFTYIKYFLYLAWNWNIRLAWFVLRDEIRGEKKYGIRTTGYDTLKQLAKKGIDLDHATIYMPAGYYMLEKLMGETIKQPHNKHLLDIGCGKGRALVVAAHFGFTNLTGIDFSKEFCTHTENSLRQLPFKNIKTDVQHCDAFYYRIPRNIEVIFLFNPFDDVIMSGVVENILTSIDKHPRNIYVIYMNPQHKELFTDAGFKVIYEHKRLRYIEGIILKHSE